MSEPIKLPLLPRPPIHLSGWTNELCEWAKDYARLAVEQHTAALHAEIESLQQIVADYPPIEAELREVSDRAFRAEAERDALKGTIRQQDAEREFFSSKCDALREELETERVRLAACGVIAMANTTETAAKFRKMNLEYRSASCDDVAKAVDREMALRAERDALRAALRAMVEVQDEACRLDHHGYCQAHYLDHGMDGCRVAAARAALKEAK